MAKKYGACKLCGVEGALMESHIIPRAFNRDIAEGGGPIREISFTPGIRDRRTPGGIYDDDILCETCERRFGSLDNYGVQFFRRPLSHFKFVRGRDDAGIESDIAGVLISHDADCVKLKLFLLSVLWRASVSSQPACEHVRLGPFSQPLSAMMRANDAGGREDFPVWLARCHSDRSATIAQPRRGTVGGVRGYTFHFGMHDVYYAVDSRRPTGDDFKLFALSPEPPIRLLYGPLQWLRFASGQWAVRTRGSVKIRQE